MKLKSLLTRIAACSALALAASAANADIYTFTITGDYSASWQMDSMPVPNDAFHGVFTVYPVPGFPDALTGFAWLTFYDAFSGGGLSIVDFPGMQQLLAADGEQLYTGTELEPAFKLGTFALSEARGGDGTYSLTISPVPEPATYALLLGGMAVVGAAAARRRGAERDPA